MSLSHEEVDISLEMLSLKNDLNHREIRVRKLIEENNLLLNENARMRKKISELNKQLRSSSTKLKEKKIISRYSNRYQLEA